MKPVTLAAAMMTHHAFSRGQDNLIDADLSLIAEAYAELRQVFEELQFLRRENDKLEEDIRAACEVAEHWREEARNL